MKIRKHADVPVSGQPKNAGPSKWITELLTCPRISCTSKYNLDLFKKILIFLQI